MNKTLKEIADSLGIDKQKVYRFVKKNHITEALQTASVKYYDETAQEQIISHFSEKKQINETNQNRINDALYEALLKQLEAKDKQLDEMSTKLDEALKCLNQEQQLNAIAQQKIQLLEQKQDQPPKRKWFWQKG